MNINSGSVVRSGFNIKQGRIASLFVRRYPALLIGYFIFYNQNICQHNHLVYSSGVHLPEFSRGDSLQLLEGPYEGVDIVIAYLMGQVGYAYITGYQQFFGL